jgi:DNA-binding NtrC family response regulator
MKKHILVVDDEADIRDLLMQILEHSGYRVSAVATAIEALRLAAKDPPQLIISDLQLEDSDGLDMIELLKAMLPNTPMMLLTGVFFDPKVVRDTLSTKVASYIQKSAPLSRIVEEVQRLIGG